MGSREVAGPLGVENKGKGLNRCQGSVEHPKESIGQTLPRAMQVQALTGPRRKTRDAVRVTSLSILCDYFNVPQDSTFKCNLLKPFGEQQNRIRESLRLEKISQVHLPTKPRPQTPQIESFFEHVQGWWLHPCPRQSVLCLFTLSVKKFFLRSNLNNLEQLEAISPCPNACYLGAETNPHLTAPSCQGGF